MDQITFKGCFGCGPTNDSGLKATFREMEDGRIEGIFVANEKHIGYPDSVHVGPLVGFLSEVMGRLAFTKDLYYLTQSIQVTFFSAVSPGVKIRAFASMKRHIGHHLMAEAKMYGPGGELIAEAEGKYSLSDRPTIKKWVGKSASPEKSSSGSQESS